MCKSGHFQAGSTVTEVAEARFTNLLFAFVIRLVVWSMIHDIPWSRLVLCLKRKSLPRLVALVVITATAQTDKRFLEPRLHSAPNSSQRCSFSHE